VLSEMRRLILLASGVPSNLTDDDDKSTMPQMGSLYNHRCRNGNTTRWTDVRADDATRQACCIPLLVRRGAPYEAGSPRTLLR
jgi:hypothetical protein